MIYFVSSAFFFVSVNALLDYETVFCPLPIRECPPNSLSDLRLSAATANEFLDRDLQARKNTLDLGGGGAHVMPKNRFSVRDHSNIKATVG